MPIPDLLAGFPTSFPQSSDAAAARYERVPGVFAVLGPLPDVLQPQLVHSLSSDMVHVCRGAPPDATQWPPSATIAAVYRLRGTGPDAVPTGRVFVRFTDGIPAQERAGDLASAGFQIDSVPGYAPHAAWLKSASEDPGAALARVDALAAVPDVVRVEAEVLSARRTR